jgi:hypothetical protein
MFTMVQSLVSHGMNQIKGSSYWYDPIGLVKLLPLPHPHSRTRKYAQLCQNTQRATQRSAGSCVLYLSTEP